ncbi:unnamed protein product [Phytophthora fragariaefolia]|uniref:Unnamed protein product n=1 Tax=Phytophthora fragariaefolia TaxID=1490495 RepID=A0A9W6UEP5_9STRA|nr:unnamed protein product [Phytophthora fragariaefolia]
MTHHFVVYVFRYSVGENKAKSSTDQSQTQCMDRVSAVVLARHASPPFRVISFRRSGIPARSALGGYSEEFNVCQQQRSLQERSQQRPVEGSYLSSIADAVARHQPAQCALPGDFDGAKVDVKLSADDCVLRSRDVTSLLQQEACLRAREYLEKGRHLLIIWHFLQYISLADVSIDINVIASNLLRVACTRSEEGSFQDIFTQASSDRGQSSLPIFGSTPTSSTPTPATGSTQPPAPERELIQMVVRLFLFVMSSRTIEQLLHRNLQLGQNRTASNDKLHEQFIILVFDLYDALDDTLRELSQDSFSDSNPSNQEVSIRALAGDILALVTNRNQFGTIRSKISALLDRGHSAESLPIALDELFHMYTTQVRELMMASATHEIHSSVVNKREGLQRAFSRRWVLEL